MMPDDNNFFGLGVLQEHIWFFGPINSGEGSGRGSHVRSQGVEEDLST